ncbi:MAG: nucleotidyltransferase family protein [Dehalococcoidia bacterium]|nr:nucleotidyltransferase family protein [Dehalococcoidia bacterium]
MKCLILASGFGTRLYPLTRDTAKALVEYKGKPLLTHIVERIPHNIDILLVTNRKFETDFRRWQDNTDRRVKIAIEDVWTEKDKKGALGSLTFGIEQENVNEDLLVLASDDYFEFDLSRFIAAYDGKNALVAVHDIGDKDRASRFGVVELEKGRIVRCEEKPMHPKTSLIGIACYLLPSRLFPVLSRYHHEHPEVDQLGHFITYLVKYDTVDAYVFTELWQDTAGILSLSGEVGTPGESK